MSTNKKTFWTGFVIGILYFLATFIFFGGSGMLMDILHFPSGLIIRGALEYGLGFIGLRHILSNLYISLSLMALTEAILLGLAFVIIRKLFRK